MGRRGLGGRFDRLLLPVVVLLLLVAAPPNRQRCFCKLKASRASTAHPPNARRNGLTWPCRRNMRIRFTAEGRWRATVPALARKISGPVVRAWSAITVSWTSRTSQPSWAAGELLGTFQAASGAFSRRRAARGASVSGRARSPGGHRYDFDAPKLPPARPIARCAHVSTFDAIGPCTFESRIVAGYGQLKTIADSAPRRRAGARQLIRTECRQWRADIGKVGSGHGLQAP